MDGAYVEGLGSDSATWQIRVRRKHVQPCELGAGMRLNLMVGKREARRDCAARRQTESAMGRLALRRKPWTDAHVQQKQSGNTKYSSV
jgi:hypothetical protein